MRVAINDACIFMDLYEMEIVAPFFSLPLDVHTSFDVYNELSQNQQIIYGKFLNEGQFSVHNINEIDRSIILQTPYPNCFSHPDKTVLYLAQKLNATILSCDGVVREYAKNYAIQSHAVLWIFDKLVELKILPGLVALKKIQELTGKNIWYRNNLSLVTEVAMRVRRWSDTNC